MKLLELLNGIGEKIIFGNVDIEIKNLSMNSKKTAKNVLFFCLNGTKTNGNLYIAEAIKNGAIAIVTEKNNNGLKKIDDDFSVNKLENITKIVVPNVRKAMAKICSNYYGNTQIKMKIIGVTGTSGKSSTSFLICEMLKLLGKSAGLIGTSGIFFGDKQFDFGMTTPESIDLFYIFDEMVKNGIEYCVMEVSAHAIFFDKIYGIDFVVKVLTNVKSDHLDFFKTKENYEKVKVGFFDDKCVQVVNVNDKIGQKVINNCKKTITFGVKTADFQILNANYKLGETEFDVIFEGKTYNIKSTLTGQFNSFNITCALAVLHALELDFEQVVPLISNIKKIDGRFDVVFKSDNFNIVIDYAHTLDSLESFLKSVKAVSKNKNIIVLGAPGERDTTKRLPMGRLAGEFCDAVILTADNPASENPRRIMFEMEQGVKKTKTLYCLIENRKKAIKKAINYAKKLNNCNVLIVGKGVETYQIVGDKHVPYSDYISVFECLTN